MNQTLPFDVPVARQVSLTRLAGELARAIGTIGKVVVEGEVHRPTTSGANRTYFVLRDRGAQLSVAVPSGRQKFCRVKEGERVAVTGSIEMLADRGALQLNAQEVVPVGSGAIAAMIAETRERLRRDGLLDRPRRRIPLLPRCIGVLCGTDAAVRKDIESVVASRFPHYPVRFLEVTVSGPGAVESLITGIELLHGDLAIDPIDVIVLARGGGDSTQMLPFSDELLCRAIAASRVPIVSAIGHDGDRPLSDEVADARAGTPSIAASMVVPDQVALLGRLSGGLSRCGQAAARHAEVADRRVTAVAWQTALDRRLERADDRLARVDWSNAPLRLTARSAARLAALDWQRPVTVRVRGATASLDATRARIEALSPARVLERGYAVVRLVDGTVVRNAGQVAAGAQIDVLVASGRIDAEVRTVHITGPALAGTTEVTFTMATNGAQAI